MLGRPLAGSAILSLWPSASAATLAGQLIRALIFDFDGLSLETEEPIYRSWKEVYEAHGVALPFELWVQTVGSSNRAFHPQLHLEASLGGPLPQDEIDRRVARRVELVLAEPLRPGVVELARAARGAGMKAGVASSSSRDWVNGHLERLGIVDLFDCLQARDDVEHVKPEPDLYLASLDCLGVEARQVKIWLGLDVFDIVTGSQAVEEIDDAEPFEMALHPIPGRARGDPYLHARGPRRHGQIRHPGPQGLGPHELEPPRDPAVDDVLRQRSANSLLQEALGMERLVRGAHGLHPQLEGQRHSARLVNLLPRSVDGLLGLEDEAVEIEDEGTDQLERQCSG